MWRIFDLNSEFEFYKIKLIKNLNEIFVSIFNPFKSDISEIKFSFLLSLSNIYWIIVWTNSFDLFIMLSNFSINEWLSVCKLSLLKSSKVYSYKGSGNYSLIDW